MISTYTTLLRTPSAWRFLTPGLVARLPYAMLGLGIVLLVKDTTGSYGVAGAAAAAMAVALAVVGPQTGRLADRYGQAAVLVPGALVHGAAVTALIICAKSGAPTWTVFASSVLAGASVPQIGSMVRARWVAKLEGGPLLPTAFAFESVTDEFTFVVGPVVATFLATGVDPGFGLAVEAVLTVVGSLLFAAQRSTAPARRNAADGPRHASAIRVAGVKVLVGAFVSIGAVFGSVQVSITAFAEESGRAGLAGALYAVFAGGSLIAGAVFGAMVWRGAANRRLMVAFALLTVGTAPLWAVPNVAVMVPVALVCGLALAPTIITGYTLVESLVPVAAKTEAFTWLTGAIGLGLAFGNTLAGVVTDATGASPAFVLTLGTAASGLLVVGLGQRVLRPAKAAPEPATVDVAPVDAAPLALGR
ncbi:MFS transporter [Yinghuangia seranimata]|uniref:MFS transporter n=1 Tax=Yinghuangia seranimata TaxID=408067 RepID=UPI00248C3FCF|nr:MFS transporter [Yinghuangia seranimata]MDI2128767.1 MFS transporter [Yinghuangia seranimata]